MNDERPDNPYLRQLYRALPRLLARFDCDPTSATYGFGDRTYWAWKLIDFPNATYQGAVNGVARLCKAELLPDWMSDDAALKWIQMFMQGAKGTTARNGSLAEALPNEGSFCVTALVAADTLIAIDCLEDRLDTSQKAEALDIVEPWINFLHGQDETHGMISNHLAVAVLALALWQKITGEDTAPRAKLFLDRILAHQSPEGWFCEYDGADPGYQSWATSSLCQVHRLQPNWGLEQPLKTSLDFLQYFAHPDGSYGGIYGSRMTRFCFPAGFEALATEFPVSDLLAKNMRQAIDGHALVTLDAIDEPNLVPLFNDYALAAVEYASRPKEETAHASSLPSDGPAFRKHFSEAGLFIDRGPRHYTIISTHKGGALLHFEDDICVLNDPGFVAKDTKDRIFTSQFYDRNTKVDSQGDNLKITANIRPVKRQLPTPFRFIILRILSLTLFRSLRLGNAIKNILAKLLVTAKPRPIGTVVRTVTLGKNMKYTDRMDNESSEQQLTAIKAPRFSAIHMASQGYWQKSDNFK